MREIRACAFGLKEKEDVIRTLYKVIKEIDLKEKVERYNFYFSVLKYFDEYRCEDYFALTIGKNYPNNLEPTYYIKGKPNAKYFREVWDYKYIVMTEHVEKFFKENFNINPFYNFENNIIYIENNKKLVVNKITEICCHNIEIKQFNDLIYFSNLKQGGVFDLETMEKIICKELYKTIETIVKENWKPVKPK